METFQRDSETTDKICQNGKSNKVESVSEQSCLQIRGSGA